MENLAEKVHFLKHEYIPALTGLDADAPRKWGKMNVQQMIEHMIEYVRIANGRVPMETITPEDRVPRMQAFLASEKTFAENTPNSLMPEEPTPARLATKAEAISELQSEIDHFFEVHGTDPDRKTANPFFGALNFEQQVQLLHKHATHHLRQFGAFE
jgi:hypothetical protein